MSSLVSFVFFLNNLILIFGQDMIQSKQVIHVESSSSSREVLLQIKTDITRLNQEQIELKNKNTQIRAEITRVRSACDVEVEGVMQQQKALVKSADYNMIALNDLLMKIQQEEKEHVKLESELKSYSVLFDLWKLKHDVIQGNLQLMSGRQGNGTSARCKQVTAEVDAEDSLTAKSRNAYWKKITITSRKRRLSAESILIDTQEKLLTRREGEKKTLTTMLEQAQKALQEEQEACDRKRLGAQGLLESTKTMLSTSEQSMTLLQTDLNIAQTYSKEVMMQTQSVKKLIDDWRLKVQEMNRALNGYSNDEKCYAKVERYN